jgi:sugar (pentulose or hexulose) kinase
VGEAIVAGHGIGEFKDIKKDAENFVIIEKTIQPKKENYERYSKTFDLYKKLVV